MTGLHLPDCIKSLILIDDLRRSPLNNEDTTEQSESFINSRVQDYGELSSKVNRVHGSFLFYRDKINTELIPQLCKKMYTNFVTRIGGTKDSLYLSGWKDLGYELGLTTEELNYIDNSVKSCPTDVVLRVFSQNDDATFDKIIQALLRLNRYDAIEGIFKPLEDLLDVLIENQERECDHGYYSDVSKSEEFPIFKPNYFANNLPEVLQWNQNKMMKNDLANLDPSSSLPNITKPSVMLSYYDDGINIAQNIKNAFEKYAINNKRVNVICLEDIKSNVLMNPELFIRHYFEEVDYVIPILSEGYFKTIKSPSIVCASSMDNTDCVYSRFIYTLMSTHYINGTGCLNRKVRCVLPNNVNRNILADLYKYPILSVWVKEDQIDKLIKSLF